MYFFRIVCVVLTAVAVVSCTSSDTDQPKTQNNLSPGETAVQVAQARLDLSSLFPGEEVAAVAATPAGTALEIAGIRFTPCTEWTDRGGSGMRAANYELAPGGDDADSATIAVFYFGSGQGGTIDANIERWIGQMVGGDASNTARRTRTTINDLAVHAIAVDGDYNPGMSGPMSSANVVKESYRMLGVIVEAPEGNVFFKLTGPKETALVMSAQLLAAIEEVEKI